MRMKKLLVAYVVVVALVLMMLFPPFKLVYGTVVINMGYSFLLSPPTFGRISAAVNVGLLFTQYVVVLIVGGLAWFVVGGREVSERDANSGHYLGLKGLYHHKVFRWVCFVVGVVLVLAVNALLLNLPGLYEKGFLGGFVRMGVSFVVLMLLWGWVKGAGVVGENNGMKKSVGRVAPSGGSVVGVREGDNEGSEGAKSGVVGNDGSLSGSHANELQSSNYEFFNDDEFDSGLVLEIKNEGSEDVKSGIVGNDGSLIGGHANELQSNNYEFFNDYEFDSDLVLESKKVAEEGSLEQIEIMTLMRQGCTREAIDYLKKPILAAAYIQKYGVTEKQINEAISRGAIKGCVVDGYLWVQDRAL